MRPTPRALRTGIVIVTAAGALGLGAASGASAGAPSVASAAAPARFRTVPLAAKGYSAQVSRLGPHTYRAEILHQGRRLTTLIASGATATADVHGLRVVLSRDGHVTSHSVARTHGGKKAAKAKSGTARVPAPAPTVDPGPAQDDSSGPDGDAPYGDIVGLGAPASTPVSAAEPVPAAPTPVA